MKRLAAVLAVLAAGTVACSSDGDGAGTAAGRAPLDVVLAASTETVEAGSAKVALKLEVTGAAQPQTMTGEGEFDFRERRGSFTMSVPSIAGQEIGEVRMIFDGDTLYQRVPERFVAQLGGKPWLKIDAGAGATGTGNVFSGSAVDPRQALAFLQGAAGEVSVAGRERVRGEVTTHYRTTLDVGRAASRVPAGQRDELEAAAELYAGQQLPAELWIDEKDRLRKIRLTVDLARMKDAGATMSGTFAMTAEYYDFGTKVDVERPPDGEVRELPAGGGVPAP